MTRQPKQVDELDTCDVFLYDKEKVQLVSEAMKGENFAKVADMFKALADETRVKIAYALLQQEELCVCDVAHIIGATTATASHHLRHLRNLGIAKRRKEGKLVFYSLDDDHVRTILSMAVVHGKEGKGNG
ncbi:metalloregulator ArsR/SmtB family transcription factor [Halalkalibacterium halodurans]|uniref:ArsR/SmtB family transcription factor n=1 Tax=Halalkalibacterium halodurans TaxID=86665 RepID=UPI0002D5BAE3|nr:winged helix-turn-helix domain-containing protein [Halalkalibacterium halodurans]MED3646616.1 metalloregulator ArsR/SmtB family transcription factor [Halalkalibacterium halodurans]MED4081059.1 metalloregulator ArsR/SmtB family transcription factor [Halalkalibacterium halodurans]MED4084877.1 metalloregulator ArsR/SmtB family transcription factor [Halalkalibacterium halodurans]MED4103469.1 metalloregulator ArsR/SmtB family transcription factor [Halalkalibacterium halodurans]MED4107755.1 metal